MAAYIAKRFLLMVPTLIAFMIVQFAPGGPIERIVAQLRGMDVGSESRVGGGAGAEAGRPAMPGGGDVGTKYGARGLDPELIKSLEKQFGFDKPPVERFFSMLGSYLTFDFG